VELKAGLQVTPTVRLTEILGKGGMGAVWLGEHSGLGARVVVKFLMDEHAKNPEAVARFKREAAASIQVKSPHVVQVFDHGVSDFGAPYIVMEHLEGQDLGRLLASGGALAPRDVSEIVRQVSRALMRAHSVGVVHRDLKPDNIFLCDAGEGESFVKILDFGIAKVDDKLSAKTQTGAVIGTPFYMSPEQIIGEAADASVDVWSLAVVAFECLTGRRPFEGETVGAVTLAIHTTKPSPSKLRPNLPKALDGWFAKAFSKVKADRFTSAKELAESFQEAIQGAPSMPNVLVFRAPMLSLVEQSTPSLEDAARVGVALGSTQLASTTGIGTAAATKSKKPLVFVGLALAALAGVGGVLSMSYRQAPEVKTEAVRTPPSSVSLDVPLPVESASALGTTAAVTTASAKPSPSVDLKQHPALGGKNPGVKATAPGSATAKGKPKQYAIE
jgi:eukaryotic-like serine/threonine-protein kinase